MVRKLRKQDWFGENGFPIAVQRRDPQHPFGLHSHDFCEIVIITGGKGVHVTGEDSYPLACGDTFVIGGDRPHDYLNLDELRLINVLFDLAVIPTEFGDLHSMPGFHAMFTLEPAWRKRHRFRSRLRLSPLALTQLSRIVDQLEDELQRRDPGFQVMAQTILLQLATFLSRCYEQTGNPQSKRLLQVAEPISHIEKYYADPIKLDQLVEMSGMSRRSFLRAFQSTIGETPIRYLIRLRIKHACRLLRTSDRSTTQIAMAVGFTDSNYFSRQFRATVGVSPTIFRRQVGP